MKRLTSKSKIIMILRRRYKDVMLNCFGITYLNSLEQDAIDKPRFSYDDLLEAIDYVYKKCGKGEEYPYNLKYLFNGQKGTLEGENVGS